jgi:hypothetical protein
VCTAGGYSTIKLIIINSQRPVKYGRSRTSRQNWECLLFQFITLAARRGTKQAAVSLSAGDIGRKKTRGGWLVGWLRRTSIKSRNFFSVRLGLIRVRFPHGLGIVDVSAVLHAFAPIPLG